MQYKVAIVRTAEEFRALKLEDSEKLVADVETFGTDPENGKLLGVALARLDGEKLGDGSDAAYVVVQEYLYHKSTWNLVQDSALEEELALILRNRELVGHSYCYDRAWLDRRYGSLFFPSATKNLTTWHADTRLMWHMSDRPAYTKKYALKDAQVEVLGWDARGDAALALQVKERGGSLKNGDHYLADTAVLGYYAGLDAVATVQLYQTTKPFFDRHDLWWLVEKMMRLSSLLDRNTRGGVRANRAKLEEEVLKLEAALGRHRADLAREVAPYVAKLEASWRDHQAAKYVSERHREEFLKTPSMWKKFNPGSDKQKRELVYGAIGLPVVEHVKPRKDRKTGRRVKSTTPAATADAFVRSVAASGRTDLAGFLDAYQKSERTETMLNNFASKWLLALKGDRIHPPFNPCGTVSFRISGYKPYFLNLPFDETDLMSCFMVEEGHTGVHADLVSVEPAVTAHYSQDPSLLKVFRDWLGDVYLDLALTLFPHDLELRAGYDPNVPCTSAVKERFKRQRKIAKIVQLAVQYTGTKVTVHLNLTKAGWVGTLDDADALVRGYWRHFHKVAETNEAIKRLHRQKGYLRNAVGRVLQVSVQAEKDVPNRFFQSSGHDILTFWTLRIYELCEERGIEVRPVLVDCHDSTSNSCPTEQVAMLEQAYVDALADVNAELGLTVPIRMEMKRFITLAGLKADEVDLAEEEVRDE